MVEIEFVIPSVLNKGGGERKLPIEAENLSDAFQKVSEKMGEDFKRKVFDLNGKPRSLINVYLNGKNIRFSSDGMATALNKDDTIYILPAVAGGEGGEDEQLSAEEMQRYSRQIMLEEIGFTGMEKLRKATVCVVGVGGIGNPVATMLSAMGVGRLRIIDRDVIEISNLHRQHLYNEDDIGKVKVEVAAERLQKINPTSKIEAIPISVTGYNAESLVDGADIVIDALDSVEARYALNDACIKHKLPFIYAGALGMLGSVCTILPGESACLRCIFPKLEEEDMPTCSTEGVHPSILYLVAGTQVSEAVKLITGQRPSLVNKLLYIDLNDLTMEKVQMLRQEACPSCGSAASISKSLQRAKVVAGDQLFVEELCGRDRGKRTYTVAPFGLSSLSLSMIIKNAEHLGYDVTSRGNLGITASGSGDEGKVSISILTSGAATIVGASSETDALKIYRTFVDGTIAKN
ncbi:MAG: 4-methyl-5(B-hydroxyethyl)-thiazole monophosphate biosynthesis protein [Nitrososphaeraceae archaeon]|nr:4-methyl-5(B-hydroxyethyl)-thiazole monophosphate biosynthesis protein [Nitrososphaeraceae archaeon]